MLPLHQAFWAYLLSFTLLALNYGTLAALLPRETDSPANIKCYARLLECQTRAAALQQEWTSLDHRVNDLRASNNVSLEYFNKIEACGYLVADYDFHNHLPLQRRDLATGPAPSSTTSHSSSSSSTTTSDVRSPQVEHCDQAERCLNQLHWREMEMTTMKIEEASLLGLQKKLISSMATCAYLPPAKRSVDSSLRHGSQKTREYSDLTQALGRCEDSRNSLEQTFERALEKEHDASNNIQVLMVGDFKSQQHSVASSSTTSPSNDTTPKLMSRGTPKPLDMQEKSNELELCKKKIQDNLNKIEKVYYDISADMQKLNGNLAPRRKRDPQVNGGRDLQDTDAFKSPTEPSSLFSKRSSVTTTRFGICELERDFWYMQYKDNIVKLQESRDEFLDQGWQLAINLHAQAQKARKEVAATKQAANVTATVTNYATLTQMVTVTVEKEKGRTASDAQREVVSSEPTPQAHGGTVSTNSPTVSQSSRFTTDTAQSAASF